MLLNRTDSGWCLEGWWPTKWTLYVEPWCLHLLWWDGPNLRDRTLGRFRDE